MSIKANIEHVNELKAKAAEKSGRTGDDVLLVAVTKLHDVDVVLQQYLSTYSKIIKIRREL